MGSRLTLFSKSPPPLKHGSLPFVPAGLRDSTSGRLLEPSFRGSPNGRRGLLGTSGNRAACLCVRLRCGHASELVNRWHHLDTHLCSPDHCFILQSIDEE